VNEGVSALCTRKRTIQREMTDWLEVNVSSEVREEKREWIWWIVLSWTERQGSRWT
jgi:hypothetical protein